MCTLAMALTGIGAAVSGYSAIMAGKAQAQQAEYQKKVAEQNAELARKKGTQAAQRGAIEAWSVAEKGRQFAGRQAAAQSGQGTNMGKGSPFAQRVDTAGMTAKDAATARYNGTMEQWGYDAQASQYGSEAVGYGMAAKQAKTAGALGAFSSVLGGASSLASQWDYWKQGGAPVKSPVIRTSDWHDGGNAFKPLRGY